MTDTIFALSSGRPPAAIAVIRVSGPNALIALDNLAGLRPEPRRATLATLRAGGEVLDRALVLRCDGPETVTGEDLVELHLHGGRAVVAAVLEALGAIAGLRAAEPGEFTRQAFANGKIDLAEAEGLADLLQAETEGQRRAALLLAGGAFSRQVEDWTQRLLTLAAAVEAQLDFSDESDVEGGLSDEWEAGRLTLVEEMETVLARAPAERLRDGIRVVLAGPPNSGKSTLLNALVERDAAITSPLAGTTRDLIEVPVAIEGVPFLMIDSAGLRASADAVEAIGVERAQAAVATADIVLWLGAIEDAPAGVCVVPLQSKTDLLGSPMEGVLGVSAVSGAGLRTLRQVLVERAASLLPVAGELSVNARQRVALGFAARHLVWAEGEMDLLIVAEELRSARVALDRVLGRSGVEDMLDALFGRFCIGK